MISIEIWVVWLHLLAVAAWLGGAAAQRFAILPAMRAGGDTPQAARRVHFITSRAVEIVILTGIMNVLLRGLASGWALSRGFTAMLSIKLLLVAAMVGLQVWAGIAWKQEVAPVSAAVQKVRIALTLQLVLGAVVVLLGLGVRSA
ncbi:MAG TPA: hypothetical protein VN648_07200 [Candidatus Methylomirabilis sp.]|nr:hypothetical protein [Candidatus Methylomirabilis sp.]